jgi:hypothetical protein
MKTSGHEQNAVYMSPELLAEARRAANEEHRQADELVSDAVRRYLKQRNQENSNPNSGTKKKRLSELFAPLRGLDVDFSRNPSTGRPIKL